MADTAWKEERKAEFGKVYTFEIPGEPVPKTRQRPPRGGKGMAWRLIQTKPQYAALKRTLEYQSHVAYSAHKAVVPLFGINDPIRVLLNMHKAGRRLGDIDNIQKSVLDGLQYGGIIPNDKQVTSIDSRLTFKAGKEDARIVVCISIDERADSIKWLAGFLGSKKASIEYRKQMGMDDIVGIYDVLS